MGTLKGEERATVGLLLAGIFGVVVLTAMPARGGADLILYREMARVALSGGNPYTHPYADFPPAKMALLALLEWCGGWAAFRTGVMVLLTVAVFRYAWAMAGGSAWSVVGAMTLVVQPLVFYGWLVPFEDKSLYAALFCTSLAIVARAGWEESRAKRLFVGLLLGILTAYTWVTGILSLVLAIHLWRKRTSWRQALETVGVSLIVPAASLLLFFPAWLDGLARRELRQAAAPVHESLWRIPGAVRIAHPVLQVALVVGIVLVALVGAARGWSLIRSMTLAYWGVLALGPEASLDRILAASFPVFLIQIGTQVRFGVLLVTLLAVGLRYQGTDLNGTVGGVALLWAPILLAVYWLMRGHGSPPRSPEPGGLRSD